MAVETVAAFCDALRAADVTDPVRESELELLAATHTDVRSFARDLISRGLLTLWQVQMIFKNRGPELQLGSYILLELLAEGGMGLVYRARHRLMGRVVALKVIRCERLSKPEAVRRFQRETQLAAQISHPNIVMAFDANQVDDVHFIAMEFVDGIDLGKLVKQKGPLPLKEACEYVRQAALGLQHAHERGLVHRDIKPSNLLLTMAKGEALRASLSGVLSGKGLDKPGSSHTFQGVIKILDLGLARLQEAGGDAANRITLEGLVVGTPDYLAPEQARNSSAVDIRADLYGLGCTLYFLLTGQPPFPEGTPTEKIVQHAMTPVPGVELLRPDVPREVAAILRKLLAKKPEDRYQTPAELAVSLEPYSLETASATRRSGLHRPLPAATASNGDTESQVHVPIIASPRLEEIRRRRAAQGNARRWMWLGLVALAVIFCAAFIVLALTR
ncbi:MAG: serine/threonine-protein kinase [Gemmataceae bacterium]